MSDKYYWLWNKETKTVVHKAIKAQFRAGQYHIPRSALRVEPKPDVKGFKVVVVLEGDFPKGTEYVEDHMGKVIFDKSNCIKSKKVKEFGPILDGWTLEEPKTEFDEWINDCWVTNQSNKYIAEYDQVDSARRAAYRNVSDPLYIEAMRNKESGLMNDAADFKKQADAAVELIKAEFPWPTQVEVS